MVKCFSFKNKKYDMVSPDHFYDDYLLYMDRIFKSSNYAVGDIESYRECRTLGVSKSGVDFSLTLYANFARRKCIIIEYDDNGLSTAFKNSQAVLSDVGNIIKRLIEFDGNNYQVSKLNYFGQRNVENVMEKKAVVK